MMSMALPAAALTQQQLDACVQNGRRDFARPEDRRLHGGDRVGRLERRQARLGLQQPRHRYRFKGDLDRAFADLDQAVGLDPKDAPAYANRGMIYQARDDLDHAIAVMTRRSG